MPRWAERSWTGWGRVHRATSPTARPERAAELAAVMGESPTVLAHGGGRSYGDAALNDGGHLVLTQRLDRFIDFDAPSGVLVAEAGVRIIDVVNAFLPRGFMLPVVPGTGFATLGGALANDVHGKNHHQAGSFSRHVEWFDLRLASGELRRVMPNTFLFDATAGGVGLTGIIERLAIRLVHVPSNAVDLRRRRIRDLDEYLAAFEEEKDRSHYVVGWIDALARGKRLGRGILEAAAACPEGAPVSNKAPRRVPFDFPDLALNPLSVRAFNAAYYRRVPSRGRQAIVPYQQFLFPLDALHEWNRIYGKRGFHQFQCVVPFDGGREALIEMLESIAQAGQGSFLAVLKAMGEGDSGFLSFPQPGYTLALDFPNAPGAVELIGRLERITADRGGRTYLAKDSTLTPELVRRMYPKLERFQSVLQGVDPDRRMMSDLARRLRLREIA